MYSACLSSPLFYNIGKPNPVLLGLPVANPKKRTSNFFGNMFRTSCSPNCSAHLQCEFFRVQVFLFFFKPSRWTDIILSDHVAVLCELAQKNKVLSWVKGRGHSGFVLHTSTIFLNRNWTLMIWHWCQGLCRCCSGKPSGSETARGKAAPERYRRVMNARPWLTEACQSKVENIRGDSIGCSGGQCDAWQEVEAAWEEATRHDSAEIWYPPDNFVFVGAQVQMSTLIYREVTTWFMMIPFHKHHNAPPWWSAASARKISQSFVKKKDEKKKSKKTSMLVCIHIWVVTLSCH